MNSKSAAQRVFCWTAIDLSDYLVPVLVARIWHGAEVRRVRDSGVPPTGQLKGGLRGAFDMADPEASA